MGPLAAFALKFARLSALMGGARTRSRRRGCLVAALVTCAGCAVVPALLAVSSVAALISAVAAQPPCNESPAACAGGVLVPLTCSHLSVSQGFGNTPWEHPHRGIDLVCPPRTAVRAVAAGRFARLDDSRSPCPLVTGKRGGYGTYAVVTARDGTQYVYGHLDAYAGAGAQVEAGALLGYEGSSGCSSGYHLHFEVRRGGQAVNPCPFLPDGYPLAHNGERCWGSAVP